ncbi:arginine--tRNA ligase [Anatilimnocola floriformis]|uniref:arginine--tRNA ligase n=1 Tax=Anatilimnocola floriformis TaxID=2948575 RepID=UPI0020C54A80|nr:arginine--tRNA ligase [Anatilimnocola floriformis]
MNILALLQQRFTPALTALVSDLPPLLAMIRPAQDAKFGDYQANFAMSLGKQLGKLPRDVATQVATGTKLDDFCNPPEVAGPGFINLKLRDDWLETQLNAAAHDERLCIAPTTKPRTFVIDYSSPNVAKPMHVGHIRSTVIGDALYRTLEFLGHKVISDNHLGDWGTQFGMIIYGYKHFVDREQFKLTPVPELSRLYRLVNKLVEYWEARAAVGKLLEKSQAALNAWMALEGAAPPADKAAAKKAGQDLAKSKSNTTDEFGNLRSTLGKICDVQNDTDMNKLAMAHRNIGEAVLAETAKLHEGDAENLKLWHEFLPNCRDEIQRVYKRLDIRFDHELGESFYHDRLAPVVEDFQKRGLAQDSQGAVCVFLDGFETPMIIRKKDGAFLYSTTDLATIAYRRETWNPDAILYVVDHRQSEHFEKLFAAAAKWGTEKVQLVHVKFGTVLGEDGKPYKTRSGDTVGLEGLLDEAVSQALTVVQENSPELSADEQRRVSETVGIGGLKYADLAHDRESDYKFSYKKMLQLNGDTATYLQYFYARCRSIFRKAETTPAAVLASGATITLGQPEERALAIQLLRFEEALAIVEADFRPHNLTVYLFDLAKTYAGFYDRCPVLKADTEAQKQSRLLLCDLTARTIATGLRLLGIGTEEKM